MRQFLRGLALLSSIVLLVGFVYYRTQKPVESGLNRETVLPSSKVGTALEMYSPDWSGKYPIADASPNHTPALIQSTKSGRIVAPKHTATPMPLATPEARPMEDYQPVFPSSKSTQVISTSRSTPVFLPGSKSKMPFHPTESPDQE